MKSITTVLPAIATTLLGAMLTIFGLNGFLNFIPMAPMEGDAATFMGGLGAAGYFFPLLKATEIVVGLALLFRRFIPLALTVLAPIVINIFAFHLFLAPQGLAVALFMVIANAGLAYHHREAYQGLFVSSSNKRKEDYSSVATRSKALAS
jgi:hypothetical protein